MDGVFVAYHNIEQVFGFQYIPLSEMDDRLFGAEGRGDRVFEKCVKLLEVLVSEAAEHFPRQVRYTVSQFPWLRVAASILILTLWRSHRP